MTMEAWAELSFSETNALTDVLNRLAAYEDTGLEPEDILNPVELAGVACVLWKLKQYEALGTVDELTTLTEQEPNTPLTLEELREMDGEPVWCVDNERWGILESDSIGFAVTFDHLTWCIEVEKLTLYRRKPKEM